MKVQGKPKSSGFKTQKEAIVEKMDQISKILANQLSCGELSNLITKRRLEWLEENFDTLREKYKGLPLEEQAFRIIFHEHMNIDPNDLKMIRVGPNKIKIEGYNFCPYLEIYKELGLDARKMCKEINHECFEKMVKSIHSNLVFQRNYKKIRPYVEFCEEYIEYSE